MHNGTARRPLFWYRNDSGIFPLSSDGQSGIPDLKIPSRRLKVILLARPYTAAGGVYSINVLAIVYDVGKIRS